MILHLFHLTEGDRLYVKSTTSCWFRSLWFHKTMYEPHLPISASYLLFTSQVSQVEYRISSSLQKALGNVRLIFLILSTFTLFLILFLSLHISISKTTWLSSSSCPSFELSYVMKLQNFWQCLELFCGDLFQSCPLILSHKHVLKLRTPLSQLSVSSTKLKNDAAYLRCGFKSGLT